VIVRFIDIGGNDDHQCLNFLFISILLNQSAILNNIKQF
jgi:hypothetical protein